MPAVVDMPERHLSVREVAARLNLTEWSVYQMCGASRAHDPYCHSRFAGLPA
jgi:hypothetical protein